MIKNKDGSYNKFSILIISLIIIIGAGMVGSTLIKEPPTIDVMSLAYVGLVISGGLTIYYGKKVFFKPKPTITHMMQSSTPDKIVNVRPSIPLIVKDDDIIKIERPVKKPYVEPKQSGFGLSMVSMIMTLVIGAVVLIIGMTIANSMVQALPKLSSDSPMSTSLVGVTETMSTAFNFAALGLIVIAAAGLIMMVSKVVSNDYD